MKIGLWGTTTQPPEGMTPTQSYHAQLDEMVLADQLGFDHYWMFEHHVSPNSPMPSPNLMIAAAARLTRRIRFGTFMNILPYHHPVRLAGEMAMLDVLTDGRVDFGIGRGIKPLEFRAFGQDPKDSREVFQEGLDTIVRIWSDEPMDFQGRYFTIRKDTPLAPPLVQRPHPPIYASAQSAESLRWAAERDYPFGQIDATVEESENDLRVYREVQRECGIPQRKRMYVTREAFVCEDEREAAELREQVKTFLVNHWQVFGRYTQFTQAGEMPDSYDAFRKRAPRLYAMSYEEILEEGLALIGTPDTIHAQVVELAERLDLSMLVLHMRFGAMNYDFAAKSMRLFAEAVIPRLVRAGLLTAEETRTSGSLPA
jgi:alkanesulfonate monooxygenase SsuD/methylene tetrahydromethanopterin reductase-like flavin-dependent oxidoreductase (luciferase family)